MPYGSKQHIPPTNYHLLAAQQEPYKKSLTLNERYLSFLGGKKREKRQENGSLAENDKTERARRLGRKKTREEIGKGNQMTGLRFQTGERHQASPASLRGAQGKGAGEEEEEKKVFGEWKGLVAVGRDVGRGDRGEGVEGGGEGGGCLLWVWYYDTPSRLSEIPGTLHFYTPF